jgi:hypothetical protein
MAKGRMWLANVGNSCTERSCRWFPTTPAPMTEIRFDNGISVTIQNGWLAAPTPELTAILDLLASRLPGYGSIPFILDEDYKIAQGLIRIAGVARLCAAIRCRHYQMLSSKRRMMRPPRVTGWLWSGDRL